MTLARKVIGSPHDDNNLNNINSNFEELYKNTTANDVVRTGMLQDGSVTQPKIAEKAVTNSRIGDHAVDHRTIYPKSIVNSKMADNAIDTAQIRDLAILPSKVDFDTLQLNKGKLYPFSNHTVSGTTYTINEKIKNTIFDVKIFGAKPDKVYSLDLILYGYSGNYQLIASEWDKPNQGNLDKASKKNIIYQTSSNKDSNENLIFVEGNKEHQNISVLVGKQHGYTMTITFDNTEIGSLVNINHNDQSGGLGLIITPDNYYYTNAKSDNSQQYTNNLIVDKKDNIVVVYAPSRDNFYTGYEMKRKTIPFESGRIESNLDLYAISRISTYERIGEDFVEVPSHTHVYSVSDKVTQDTIFKEVGAADYSGGFFHGDEKIKYLSIVIGNKIMTNEDGRVIADSAQIIQHTELFSDTSTSSLGNTEAFALVKKVHHFDVINGYTLKSEIEFLKDVTLDMSNVGALSMNHNLENSSNPNFTHVVDLDLMETAYIQGEVGKVFGDTETKHYKFIGWYKEVLVTIETDSDFFNSWVQVADSSSKLYTRVIPLNGTAEKGKVIKSSVNYRFSVTGVSS